jgi:hypothetical protein
MHLSLLSDAYVSDSFNDAGSLEAPTPSGPLHFAALCRGLVVLVALALPVGLTLLASASPAESQARSAPNAHRVTR